MTAFQPLDTSHLEIHSDKEQVSRVAAQATVVIAQQAVQERGRFTMAFAGGSTPRRLYEFLATEYHDLMPWDHVLFFWGDERYVPHTDPKSNFHMVRESMLTQVPIDADQIFPMPTEGASPEADAAQYDMLLKEQLGEEGILDLVLLGMGDDGHTASLFPGSPALGVSDQWAVAAPAPVAPTQRITMTYPLLNQARNVFFLVAGASKGQAMQCVFGEKDQVTVCPAAHVRPNNGRLIWWVDEAAVASVLPKDD